jgi:hypothetical protein
MLLIFNIYTLACSLFNIYYILECSLVPASILATKECPNGWLFIGCIQGGEIMVWIHAKKSQS